MAVACFLFNPGQVSAQGGPSIISEDPGTPGAGNREINTATLVEVTEDEWLFEGSLVDANYGWGKGSIVPRALWHEHRWI